MQIVDTHTNLFLEGSCLVFSFVGFFWLLAFFERLVHIMLRCESK